MGGGGGDNLPCLFDKSFTSFNAETMLIVPVILKDKKNRATFVFLYCAV